MTDDQIISLVNQYPQGLTSVDAANISGEPLQNLSSRLSKLFAYGKIARMTATRERQGGMRARWMPKDTTR